MGMEGFDALVQMYREALPEKRKALEQEWRVILAGGPDEPPAMALRYQLHQLAGSAGAYGYDAMGEMARALEKRPDARDVCSEAGALMQALREALRAASLPAEV